METIIEMPQIEDLLTPEKSIKQVEKKQLKRLKDKKIKLMFDALFFCQLMLE